MLITTNTRPASAQPPRNWAAGFTKGGEAAQSLRTSATRLIAYFSALSNNVPCTNYGVVIYQYDMAGCAAGAALAACHGISYARGAAVSRAHVRHPYAENEQGGGPWLLEILLPPTGVHKTSHTVRLP